MGGEMMVRVCRFVQTRRRYFSFFFLWEPDCGRALPVNNSIKTSLWGSAAVAWGKHSNIFFLLKSMRIVGCCGIYLVLRPFFFLFCHRIFGTFNVFNYRNN